MKENQEITKVEFLITLNNNFVIQRFFNVRNINQTAKSSIELTDYMFFLSEELKTKLRNKTVFYMLENQLHIEEDPKVLDTSNTEDKETFNLIIRIGNETIFHRIIDAKLYPPKVRYTLDVRSSIKTILKDLVDIFSSKNLSYNYLNYSLD